ncbi:hypothetical protein VE02_00259 [Pseudogymnoascus sp. 03VT05]|nr:hypothetical protein VE02_00259 [Pseudogymnoascus sp. 03VT05]
MADQEPDADAPTSVPATKACEALEAVTSKKFRDSGRLTWREQAIRRAELAIRRAEQSIDEENGDHGEFFESMEILVGQMMEGSGTSHELQQQVDALTTRICVLEDELKGHKQEKMQASNEARSVVQAMDDNTAMLRSIRDQEEATGREQRALQEQRAFLQEQRALLQERRAFLCEERAFGQKFIERKQHLAK